MLEFNERAFERRTSLSPAGKIIGFGGAALFVALAIAAGLVFSDLDFLYMLWAALLGGATIPIGLRP